MEAREPPTWRAVKTSGLSRAKEAHATLRHLPNPRQRILRPLRIRFHDLRHTAATLLFAQSINPKVVSEMLGHPDIAITLSLFGHVTPQMQKEAADTMDQLFEQEG